MVQVLVSFDGVAGSALLGQLVPGCVGFHERTVMAALKLMCYNSIRARIPQCYSYTSFS